MKRLLSLLVFTTFACAPEMSSPPSPHDDGGEQLLRDVDIARLPVRDGYVHTSITFIEPITRAAAQLTTDEIATNIAITLEVRASDAWIALDEVWREGARSVLRADVRATTSLELRIRADDAPLITSLTWAGSVPEVSGNIEASTPSEAQALDGFLADIGMIPREWWGARPSGGCGGDGPKYRMALHHTAGPESVNGDIGEALRQAQSFHMDGRGFCDLAYHFAVGVDGSLWEGRPLHFGGAHTLNENGGNIGIVSIGCFHPGCGNEPTQALVNANSTLVHTLAANLGIPIDAGTVKGHRDHPNQSTACPGDFLHARLEEIRVGAPTNHAPGGVLDGVACDRIHGWAFDADTFWGGTIDTHVYIGGAAGDPFAAGFALRGDQHREDLCAFFGTADCNLGFSMTPPRAFLDGVPRPVFAYGIDIGGTLNTLLINAPQTLHCAPPPIPDGELRHVTSPESFAAWQFSWLDVAAYPNQSDVDARPRGDALTFAPSLFVTPGRGEVWIADTTFVNGVQVAQRRHVPSPEAMAAWRLDWNAIVTIDAAAFDTYVDGPPLLPAPTLLRGPDGAVYVVDVPRPVSNEIGDTGAPDEDAVPVDDEDEDEDEDDDGNHGRDPHDRVPDEIVILPPEEPASCAAGAPVVSLLALLALLGSSRQGGSCGPPCPRVKRRPSGVR